jgi:uncharacterized protein YciI
MMLPILIAALLSVPVQDTTRMTTYQMVFLYKTAVPDSSIPNLQAVQQEHLDRLAELNRKRINLLYGPVNDGGQLAGIAVLAVASADAARSAFAQDPYVKSGALRVDVRPWFGPKDFFQLPASYDVLNPDTLEPFVLGLLVDGPNRTQDAATAAEIQKGHLAYITELHERGKLALAGPFGDDKSPRGIVIYRANSLEEANGLAAGDPAVKAGRLAIEPHPWLTLKGILR